MVIPENDLQSERCQNKAKKKKLRKSDFGTTTAVRSDRTNGENVKNNPIALIKILSRRS